MCVVWLYETDVGHAANTLHDQNRYAEAIADFSKAIEINPSDTADVYARRAASYEVMGNEGQAARDRAKAKELGFKP